MRRTIVIDSGLFPKILIRTIDVDYIGFSLNSVTDPHAGGFRPTGQKRPKIKSISSNEDQLSLEIELVFSSQDRNGPIADFLDKEFINKYLRIRAVMVDNVPTMTKIIEEFNGLSIKKLTEMAEQGIIQLSTKSVLDVDFEASVGEEIKDNIIRVNFRHSNTNPEYLAIAAFSYFDILAMEEDLNLDLSSNKQLLAASSTLAIENVFVNSSLVSESFIFRDSVGEIWSGPVQLKGTQYFKYGTNEILDTLNIPNGVVSDYRPIQDFQEKNVELKRLQTSLADKFDTVSIHNKTRNVKSKFFSDLFLTQDENANARFAFFIDYKAALVSEGRYGFLFKNHDPLRMN